MKRAIIIFFLLGSAPMALSGALHTPLFSGSFSYDKIPSYCGPQLQAAREGLGVAGELATQAASPFTSKRHRKTRRRSGDKRGAGR